MAKPPRRKLAGRLAKATGLSEAVVLAVLKALERDVLLGVRGFERVWAPGLGVVTTKVRKSGRVYLTKARVFRIEPDRRVVVFRPSGKLVKTVRSMPVKPGGLP